MRAGGIATLIGKVAVITGSTQGLGLAMAWTFAGAGAAVMVSNHAAEDVARATAWWEEASASCTSTPAIW